MTASGPHNGALHPIGQLGPFDLVGFLGKGAMGQVWRARHREQDVHAAIKVVTTLRAQQEEYLRQFRHETRAVAGLCHPGIVTVFDYGEVTPEVEALTLGDLRADSPYLAMELCPRGSLASIGRQLSFASIRSILLSLLDALAHAHARGVIHRDIKPANILLADDTDGTGVKLSDFGLAALPERASHVDKRATSACGTPAYMSPEQCLGRWRDLGPWSDLYSIGCLAYTLVCGEPPFGGRSIVSVAKKHLSEPVPPLAPKVAVPEEFEAWVRRLLRKKPHQRYQCAADAAWALLLMDVPHEDHEPTDDLHLDGRHSTLMLRPFEPLLESTGPGELLQTTDAQHATDAVQEGSGSSPSVFAPKPPPLTTNWQYLVGRRPSIRLLGAGLGLYELRHIPLVGRHEERHALWKALCETVENRGTRAVLVRGPSGVGKSYLAEWLCERAAESGTAVYLRATHSLNSSGGEGLGKMLSRHFRAAGLDRAELVDRLQRWLEAHGVDDAYLRDGLAEVLSPATEADVERGMRKVRFARPNQRYALIVRVLGLIARRRAVVVWLDDLQWSSTSLEFLQFCLDSDACADTPLMVIGTIRDEAVPDLSEAKPHIARLSLDERITHIAPGPLAAHEHADFIEKLLYLDPALARTVADRTAGNPLFAVQLVGDWVTRGVLELGDDGFVLADGEQAQVPDTIFDVWSSRLDKLFCNSDASHIRAIELAAVLGFDVEADEWRACLQLEDAELPAGEVQLLLQHRLLEETDTGYRFVHAMLRETLVRRAKEGRRFVDLNRVCSKMLQTRYAEEPHLAERLGRHLLAAREHRDALTPLYEGAKASGNAAEFERCQMLLDLRRQAIDAVGTTAVAERACSENQALRALCRAIAGDADEATMLAASALERAEALGDPCLIATCCYRFAQSHLFLNDFDACLPLLARARELVEANGCERRLRLEVEGITGQALARLGRADEAITHLYVARDIATDIGDTLKLDNILWALGSCERHRDNLAEAEALLREAIDRGEVLGHRMMAARALISLGDVIRLQGRLDEAADLYRQVLSYGHSEEQHETLIGRINLALVAVQTSRFDEAEPILDELQQVYEARQNRTMLLYVASMQSACLAAHSEWCALEKQLDDVLARLDDAKLVDADLAICFEIAARLCANSSQPRLAARLFEAASSQWEAAGDRERARAIRHP